MATKLAKRERLAAVKADMSMLLTFALLYDETYPTGIAPSWFRKKADLALEAMNEIATTGRTLTTVQSTAILGATVLLSERKQVRKAGRDNRAKGGKAAAEKRRTDHIEKTVKPLRREYRDRLKAGRQERPRETLAALSPKIITAMAKAHKRPVKRMRDLIKPRKTQKDVH